MSEQAHFYGRLVDGATFIFIGFFIIWLGFKQKTPKRIVGISYRAFACGLGILLFAYGVATLAGWP